MRDHIQPIARHPRLWLRISILLIAVVGCVLVLISYLNYSNYRKSYIDLNYSRYLIVAKDLRQTIVSGMNIGIKPLENNRLLPEIRELLRREGGVRYIGVLGETGEVFGQGALPAGVADEWRRRLADTGAEADWHSADADTFQVGIPFVNNFNIKTGAVVIGYARAPIDGAADAMLRKLALDTVAALACLAVVTLGAVYLLTRNFSRELAAANASIDAIAGGVPTAAVPGHFLGEEVARDINQFGALSQRVVDDIAQLEQELAAGPGSRP